MLARAVVGLLAVAVLAWFGVMERDARLQARAVAAAQPPHGRGDLDRAESDFRRARTLNPDTSADFGRAFVLQASGRQADAIALLEGVVREEPENITAWGTLLTLTRDARPATARRALAAMRRLDPLRAPRR